MGRLNIAYCTIEFSNKQSLRMLGEQKAAVVLFPGTYTFFAYSGNPYDSNGKKWKSNKVTVNLKPGEIRYFILKDINLNNWKLEEEK